MQGGALFPKLYILLILHLKIIELSLLFFFFFLLRKQVTIPYKTAKTTEIEKSGEKTAQALIGRLMAVCRGLRLSTSLSAGSLSGTPVPAM